MKYLSIDIETTGLDVKDSEVIEFGAVLEDSSTDSPLSSLPKFHCYIIPENGILKGSMEALYMNYGILEKLVKKPKGYKYLTLKSFPSKFYTWLLKQGFKSNSNGIIHFTPAGKNFDSFDRKFLEKIFKENLPRNKIIRMLHRSLDPTILFVDFTKDKTLPNLQTCKERAKLGNTKVAHTAIEDALDVIELLRLFYDKKIEF